MLQRLLRRSKAADDVHPGLTEFEVSRSLYGPQTRSGEVSPAFTQRHMFWTDWDGVAWA